jgi:hypothetical protein
VNVYRLARLLFAFILLAHWVGCLWHILNVWEEEESWVAYADDGLSSTWDGGFSAGSYTGVVYTASLMLLGEKARLGRVAERVDQSCQYRFIPTGTYPEKGISAAGGLKIIPIPGSNAQGPRLRNFPGQQNPTRTRYETYFVLVGTVLGACLNAVLFGQVNVLLSNFNRSSSRCARREGSQRAL